MRSRKIAVMLALFALAGFAVGYLCQKTYTIGSLRTLIGQKRAILFDGKRDALLRVGEVDTSELVPHLQQASWTNAHLMRKGAWTLEFSNGKAVYVSFYGDFFWVSETPGNFLIPADRQTSYRSIVSSVLAEPTFAWRIARNSKAKEH